VRGVVTTIRADGRQTCRLTPYVSLKPNASPSGYWITSGAASNPHLSPTERQLAYLTTTGINSHDVWIVAANGIPRGPQRVNVPSKALDRESPSWSPGGRYLAYHEGEPAGKGSPASYAGLTVVIRRVRGDQSTVVSRVKFSPKGSPNAFGFGEGPTIAWSPDGRKLASIVGILQGRTAPNWPVALEVGIGDVRTGRTQTIGIRFPRGMLGRTGARGSYPTGNNLAWTADSKHLVISTFGRGAGGSLTGLWHVGQNGGMAHLFVGTRADVQDHVPAGEPLARATGFLMAPNRRLLVTDPGNRFWVADAKGGHGRFTNTSTQKGCVLAQFSWLPDSSGLAYVTECTVAGSGLFRLSLYSVKLRALPHLLLQLISREPDALDLGPPQRCVACA
jgi:dipeptidyl aminopeptidase/acylaminoacyl peptidase